jgi:hypothetical protein
MARTIFFAGGDSYPADRPAESLLRQALEGPDSAFLTHDETFNKATGTAGPGRIDVKGRVLEQAIRDRPGQEIYLIGRSAGARTVTLAAQHCHVTAIVCMFYPFRQPQRQLEPKRFAHLRTVTTPTLLLQGVDDEYGGAEITENYQLSDSICVKLVAGHHCTKLAEPEGSHIVPLIVGFIEGGWRRTGQELEGFDEAFYLGAYPDAGKAIAAGLYASGEDHFRKVGRKECRGYRVRYEAPRRGGD